MQSSRDNSKFKGDKKSLLYVYYSRYLTRINITLSVTRTLRGIKKKIQVFLVIEVRVITTRLYKDILYEFYRLSTYA